MTHNLFLSIWCYRVWSRSQASSRACKCSCGKGD